MRFQLIMAALSCAMLTACGAGFSPVSNLNQQAGNSQQSAPAQPVVPKIDMYKIQASVTSSQTAMKTAQTAIGSIFNSDGTLNWSIFLGGVDFTKLGASTQTCLANAFPKNNVAALILTAPADIGAALKCILDDVATVAGIASTDLNTALSELQAALASVPAGSAEAAAIQTMINDVQNLQSQYSGLMQSLANQLSLVNATLSTVPTLVTGAIPVPILSLLAGATVSSFIKPIEAEITHFQSQLAAL